MKMNLCINCGIATDRCNAMGRRLLKDDAVLSIVREWVAPQTVNENDIICQSCWTCANSVSLDGNRPEEPPLGHRRVCTLCGRSLLRKIRCHQLKIASIKDRRVLEIVKEWILPRTVSVSSILCHSCWVRATKASRHFHSSPSKQESQPAPRQELPTAQSVPSTIVLPAYFRSVETESRCFVEGCQRRERNRITLSMRKQLLNMYNYYVPPNNRVCDFHLSCTSWDFLNDNITDNIINSFTANQIQDMMLINKSDE